MLLRNRSLELLHKQERLRSKLVPELFRSKLELEQRSRTCVHANGQTIPCEEHELARNKRVQLRKLELAHSKPEPLHKLARKLVLERSSRFCLREDEQEARRRTPY